MTREQERQHINSLLPHELSKAKAKANGHDTYICPLCNNGSGADGTGIATKDGKRYKCFNCGFYGDYLDYLKKQHNTDKEDDIFKLYNLTIDSGGASPSATPKPKPEPVEQVDYTQYFKECNARAGETEYFSLRGISQGMIDYFKLGYDPAWKHPKAPPSVKPTARVIIPTSKNSYVARDTDPDANKQYAKMKIGTMELFNAKALASEMPYIFVVEGEFDALSVIEAGGEAIALGSVTNKNKFLQAVKDKPPTSKIVLSLDPNEAGQKAQAAIKAELGSLQIPFLEANISGEYGDPNEHWQNDTATFTDMVLDPLKEQKDSYLKKNAVVNCLDAFMGEISKSADTPAVPTGFSVLDDVFDGGLYEGLYILGAISSLGKTSFCLQVADQIAQQGQDVIIFSLEMSKYELVSKSLSRLTIIADKGKNDRGYHYARTARQITAGAKYKLYSQREKDLINNAVATYAKEYAPNLFIHEGVGNIGAEAIKGIVKEHISFTGNRPVVFVDYLQILQPHDIRATDKQITDRAVLELKRMTRDYKIPVLAVSSFNRDNYLSPVNMASFKESGAIEYSSDVLLGLQFGGMNEIKQTDGKKAESLDKIEKLKKANPRKVELRVLKNRNGAAGSTIKYDYYPRFNLFREDLDTSGI